MRARPPSSAKRAISGSFFRELRSSQSQVLSTYGRFATSRSGFKCLSLTFLSKCDIIKGMGAFKMSAFFFAISRAFSEISEA